MKINLSKINTEEQARNRNTSLLQDKGLTSSEIRYNKYEASDVNHESFNEAVDGRQTGSVDVIVSDSFHHDSNPADSDKSATEIATRFGKNSELVKIDETEQRTKEIAGAILGGKIAGTILQGEKEETLSTTRTRTQMLNNRKSDISGLKRKESASHKKSVLGNNRKVS